MSSSGSSRKRGSIGSVVVGVVLLGIWVFFLYKTVDALTGSVKVDAQVQRCSGVQPSNDRECTLSFSHDGRDFTIEGLRGPAPGQTVTVYVDEGAVAGSSSATVDSADVTLKNYLPYYLVADAIGVLIVVGGVVGFLRRRSRN